MNTKKVITLLGFISSFLPTSAFAQSTYNLLAPLPGLSGNVTMAQYLSGIVTVIIGLAGILAVLMIVICGVQMIGSPSVSQKSASKSCITSAIFGLLLALSSWVILNTINTQLLKSDTSLLDLPELPPPPPPKTADAPLPTQPAGFYFRYKAGGTGPIINSPMWVSTDSCLEAIASAKSHGDTIEQTPAESGKECFQVFPPPPGPPPSPGAPPPGPPLNEAEARISICGNNSCIGAKPIGINNGPCPTPGSYNCTNVANFPSSVIPELKKISASVPIVITGGTETASHKSHGPGKAVFDLRKTTALSNYIKANATQSAPSFVHCRYLLDGFWFTDENEAHWHICGTTESSWYCQNKDRDGKTLPDGIAKNCPR